MNNSLACLPIKLLAGTVGVGLCCVAVAQDFVFRKYSSLHTDDLLGPIGEIVTTKFAQHYPANKYEIVIVSEAKRYRSGPDAFVHASVGVARITGIELSLVPTIRYTGINYMPRVAAHDLKAEHIKVVLGAVRAMMIDCDETPDCRLTQE